MKNLISYFIETEWGSIHIETVNKFDPKIPVVIFLHGANPENQNTNFWEPILHIINNYCQPILVDRFGHGQSNFTGELKSISYELHLESLIQLIKLIKLKFEINKLAIIGRSLGGSLTINLIQKIPESIFSIGLIAPAGIPQLSKIINEWKNPITVLWDTNDPMISFNNFEVIKNMSPQVKLFTIGSYEYSIKSVEKNNFSHTPELMSDELFEEFIKEVINSFY